MAIEEPPFQTLTKDSDFEVRRYEAYVVVGTEIEGDPEDAGNKAFQPLFGYISGKNESQSKFSMTAPVGQKTADAKEGQKFEMTAPVGQASRSGKNWIYFVLPKGVEFKNAPKPLDPTVRLEEVPSKDVAVVRYSGRWTTSNYDQALAKLREWMAKKDLPEKGEPVWARYNSPFSIWFLRRNEVQIETVEQNPK